MFKVTLKAFLLTVIIALVIGLLGLVYRKIVLVPNPPDWHLPDNLIAKDRFIMVGSMDNFSYLGGLIGLFVSIVFTILQKRKHKKSLGEAQGNLP